jgi:NitT/TauT family transport system ATP-binding protein
VRDIISIEIGRPRRDIRAIQTDPEFMRKRMMIWDALHDATPRAEPALEMRAV